MTKKVEIINSVVDEFVQEIPEKLWPLYLLVGQLKEEEEKLAKKRKTLYEQIRKFVSSDPFIEAAPWKKSLKVELVYSFRRLWQFVSREDELSKTSLALVHGLVERASVFSIENERTQAWLWKVYETIQRGEVDEAHELEAQARELDCGLPVLDPERDPISIRALFGVVREIEDGEARLSMSIPEGKVNPEAPLWESCSVPVVEIPKEYANEDSWVAWVERTYECDGEKVSKGRFEPASFLPLAKPMLKYEVVLKYSEVS